MKKNIARLILAFGVCLLSVSSAIAQFEIHPRLSLTEEYTDNLFLNNSNEQEDWITTIAPGIALTYSARSVELTVDYSLSYKSYQENSSSNSDEFDDIQRANATALFFNGRPFTLSLSETISRETLDESDNSAEYNELVNKSTVYKFVAAPEYRLELTPSFSLVFGYTYGRTDYVEAAGNDSEEHGGTFSLVKELSSNTTVSIDYSYKAHQSDTDADFDQQDYTLNLKHQVGPRLNVTAGAGFSTVEYDDGGDSEDTNWLLGVDYKLSEALALNANINQSFSTSATDGLTKSRSAVLGIAYAKSQLMASAELYYDQSDYVLTSREDQSFGSRFDITIPLTKAFSTSFDAEYEKVSFDSVSAPDEDADRYSLGCSLGYNYRRFDASLGYKYRLNESDISDNDYTNNVVTLSAAVRF